LLERALAIFQSLKLICRKLGSCIYGSPVAFVLTLAVALLLLSAVLAFNIAVAKLLTVPGAIILNMGLSWLTLRLAIRVLVFPGSIICWKRNTEATYRIEISKQFTHHLEQFRLLLQVLVGRLPASGSGATAEGALLGCMVVAGLERNFEAQQDDQVRFTKEQTRVRELITGVDAWVNGAKIHERRGQAAVLVGFFEWLQHMSQMYRPSQLAGMVADSPFAPETKAQVPQVIESLEELIAIMSDLQKQPDSVCATAKRFFRVPTVGSLHQLRAELAARYKAHHHWVTTPSGRKIDAMLIPCDAEEGASLSSAVSGFEERAPSDASSTKEDVPLKEIGSDSPRAGMGPVVVWCNPNAAYYETMAYESHWVDFYLSQGCSVFLFNYSGFGRSQGRPTPSAVAADGDAVIDFLRRRGYTNVAVHGRSIGGIAACSLARANPDIVRVLVADRTFSTLAKAATYTFGAWAAHALNLGATIADNCQNYLQARCYKVMICDPKDCTIPDLAALRTEVAEHAVEAAPASERLILEPEKLQGVAEAWVFLETLVAVCDRRADGERDFQPFSEAPPEAKRPARQVVMGKPQVAEADARQEAGEDLERLVGSRATSSRDGAARGGKRAALTSEWLEEHVFEVRSAMATSVDAIRIALDVIGTQWNSSGLTLDDALSGRGVEECCTALRCFLANLQVWGSLGALREPFPAAVDREIEMMLKKGTTVTESRELTGRLTRLAASMTPERLASYHRHLSRAVVADARRGFRQCMVAVRKACDSPSLRDSTAWGPELRGVTLNHLKELEGLLGTIYRHFKCVDMAGGSQSVADQSDDSEEGWAGGVPPPPPMAAPTGPSKPVLDRSVVGYVMCIECGHNGALHDGEMHHLSLHLRAARFGKWAVANAGGACEGVAAGSATTTPAWRPEEPSFLA